MKYVYTLLVAAALMAGCNPVLTQSSISHDIAQITADQQRVVALSMTMEIGGGSDAGRAVAMANYNKYEIAESKRESAIQTNAEIALGR